MSLDVRTLDNHKIQVLKNCDSKIVVFLLYELKEDSLLYSFLKEKEVNCIALSSFDYEKDFSPFYKEDVLKKGDCFKGNAKETLNFLLKDVIPFIKENFNIVFEENILLGYSLGGLFSLYASTLTSFFSKIGCISASFWYPSFIPYIKEKKTMAKDIYLSLGDKESNCKNILLKTSLNCQFQVLNILNEQKKNVLFELNQGGHFNDIENRIRKGLNTLLKPSLYE